jgi:hypothetical protein
VKEVVEKVYGADRVRTIKCGMMSVSEQIKLFSSAQVVIGAEVGRALYLFRFASVFTILLALQGACLTNIIYMQPGRVVVNLQPAMDPFGLLSRCGLSYFWQLAETCALQYHALLLPDFSWLDPMEVPLKALSGLLRRTRA